MFMYKSIYIIIHTSISHIVMCIYSANKADFYQIQRFSTEFYYNSDMILLCYRSIILQLMSKKITRL